MVQIQRGEGGRRIRASGTPQAFKLKLEEGGDNHSVVLIRAYTGGGRQREGKKNGVNKRRERLEP